VISCGEAGLKGLTRVKGKNSGAGEFGDGGWVSMMNFSFFYFNSIMAGGICPSHGGKLFRGGWIDGKGWEIGGCRRMRKDSRMATAKIFFRE
jgi:hypothetical protein